MSVRDLQAVTDADEFSEWLAYQEIDPATEERADFRAATIAAVIMTIFKGKPVSPFAFMPYTEEPERKMPTQEQLEAKMTAWARGRTAMQTRRKATRG